MTTTPNTPPNENSDGPDVNDVLDHEDETQPDPEVADDDVNSGLSEG